MTRRAVDACGTDMDELASRCDLGASGRQLASDWKMGRHDRTSPVTHASG